jgi:SAM-dependent methyltransferase
MSVNANVVWHDLECGLYRADLPLWRELAFAHHEGPILDVGAGTGRVTLDLAATGREVIALDCAGELLGALRERADQHSGAIETVCADARDFTLRAPAGLQVSLCLVPMQTIQLLGGLEGRLAFLRSARAHLRPGGLLACAIVTELEPFDCDAGTPGPTPETVRIGELTFSSHARRVHLGRHQITIERERHVIDESGVGPDPRADQRTSERNVISLDRVSPRELEREAAGVGLGAERARMVEPTEEHTGSTVVMLRG